MTASAWFAETGAHHIISYEYHERLYGGRSPYQFIDIVETLEYGRMLFLDGVAQSSERDEFIYHEALVHPAVLTHPDPQTICIIGGAEGATLKETLKHPTVSRVVMVDIDEMLVRACQEHLPGYSCGAYDDPRLELIFGDGRGFLEETDEVFDAVIIDLSDPLPDSPGVYLFTREFYQLVYDRLSEEGAAGVQGESLQPWRVHFHARLVNTMATIFPNVFGYQYNLPSFHEVHGMILASKGQDPRQLDLGGRITQRGLELKYLSPNYMPGLFYMPGYVEEAYSQYSEILTDDQPYTVIIE